MTNTVLVAFGANLGNPIETVQLAYRELSEVLTAVASSPLYRSKPVGGVEQDDFINAVALFDTELSGLDILTRLHEIEDAHSRTREVRWGPRTLDLDVIAFWENGDPVTSADPILTLPHPRAWERVFVTAPWTALKLDGQFSELPGAGPVNRLESSMQVIERLEIGLER
jgi:2-amino-4-hydroxy-6-hydroxymethyldihydropteridine diphosphokinase